MSSIPIIPIPNHVTVQAGKLVLPGMVTVSHDGNLASEAELLIEGMAKCRPSTAANPRAMVQLQLQADIKNPEAYRLTIDQSGILISAGSAAGAFYGCQSLLQLVSSNVDLPCVVIDDQPRFGWRGLMLDVSRHFFNADQVCRLLDLMAIHKLNVFHWHLTDDQGWRLPVKRYPKLTEIGSIRKCTLIGHERDRPRVYDDKPYGGYYTAEDIRRVVAYAARRHITVVPEIDMPGHMQAAVTAYPELGNTDATMDVRCHWGISHHILNPQQCTVQFMQHVLEEVLELFPGKFIHIGGDEAHKEEWTESRAAQDRMRELGLHSEAEMQSWFIRQMDQFLTARGRRLIGWDEILEGGLAENAAVMSSRGTAGGTTAAGDGHDVVMAPNQSVYFDYYQAGPEGEPLAIGGMTTLEKVYGFEPITPELDPTKHHHILGGQGQLWCEYISTMEKLEYMAFPRACALAETLWSVPANRNWSDFKSRMQSHRKVLDAWKVKLGAIPAIE